MAEDEKKGKEKKAEEPKASAKPAAGKKEKPAKEGKKGEAGEKGKAKDSGGEEEEEFIPKPKPDLSHDELRLIKVRREASMRRPAFLRQEAHTHYRLMRRGWRKPRGLQSRRRQHESHRVNVVSIGYGGPALTRDLHPSGFQEVRVSNVKELERVDPKRQAARVTAGVGRRKREDIEVRAEDLGVWVLNPKMDVYVVKVKDAAQIVELALSAKGDKVRRGGDAVLIDPSVSDREREDIVAEAEDRGIKVLNPGRFR